MAAFLFGATICLAQNLQATTNLAFANSVALSNGISLNSISNASLYNVIIPTNSPPTAFFRLNSSIAGISPNLPQPYALFTADSFNNYTDGTPVTMWPDISGNGRHFNNMTGVTFASHGMGGHPALYCSSGTATNPGFFNAPLDTNCSITIVWMVPTAPNGYAILMASGTNHAGDNFEFYGTHTVQNLEAIDQERAINEDPTNESLIFWPAPEWQTHVTTLTHQNGATFNWMENQRVLTTPTALSPEPLQNYINPNGFGLVSGNFYLWNNSTDNRQATAYIAVIRIDYPALTLSQVEAVQRAYDDYYQTTNGDINLYGESQMNGEDGSDTNPVAAFTCPAQYLAAQQNNFYTVEFTGSGGVSSGTLTNLQQELSGVKRTGRNIVVWHESCGNEEDTNFSYITTNLLLFCQAAHGNGQQVVVCSPIDSRIDTFSSNYLSGGTAYETFTNYSYWLHTNWQTFADGIADSYGDPVLWQSNAWQNFTYRCNDGIGHLNSNGISYWMNNYVIPAINSLPVSP